MCAYCVSGGANDMMMYDPTVFGTPLPMLQIPAPAIQSIQSKLATAGCLITRYTQDCRDLPSELAGHVKSVMVDVGYICRKCHMVFPHRSACVNHQQLFCYQGSSASDTKAGSIIKLEQIQYQCPTCENGDGEKFSTVAQVQAHIGEEKHRNQQQHNTPDKTEETKTPDVNESESAAAGADSTSQTPGDPAPKAQTPPPSSSSPHPSSPPSSSSA